MEFSVFVFSLHFGVMVSAFLEINTELKIQIWLVPEKIEETKEILLSEQIKMYSSHTYIILENMQEDDIFHYSLFYWVGSGSSLEKRRNAIKSAALLQDYLKKAQNSQLIYFGREMEGSESDKFLHLFGFNKQNDVLNLYSVEGTVGQLIHLCPTPHKRFYVDDVLVLQKENEVLIWIANKAKSEKAKAAHLLAKRIVKVDLQKKDEEIEQHISVFDDVLEIRNTEKFYENFFKFISILPPNFQQYKASKKSNHQIAEFMNKIVKVDVFYINAENIVRMNTIKRRPLHLENFRKSETFLLKNIHSRYIFVFLGKEANAELVQCALITAEEVLYNNPEYWRNITIVLEGELLPTPFIIHFKDEIQKLLALPIRLN